MAVPLPIFLDVPMVSLNGVACGAETFGAASWPLKLLPKHHILRVSNTVCAVFFGRTVFSLGPSDASKRHLHVDFQNSRISRQQTYNSTQHRHRGE